MKKFFILIAVGFLLIPLVPLFSEDALEGVSDIEKILIEYFYRPFERLEFTEEELDFIRSREWAITQQEYYVTLTEAGEMLRLAAPQPGKRDQFPSILAASDPAERELIRRIILRSHAALRFLEEQEIKKKDDEAVESRMISEHKEELSQIKTEMDKIGEELNEIVRRSIDEEISYSMQARLEEIKKESAENALRANELKSLIQVHTEIREDIRRQKVELARWVRELAVYTDSCFLHYIARYGEEILLSRTLIDRRYDKAEEGDLVELGLKPVTIMTEPSGGEVFFEDRLLGQAPVTLPWILPGEYRFSAEKDLYKRADLAYTPGENTRVTIPMEKAATGFLVLELEPHRGKLSIDGRGRSEKGKAEVELTTGPHSVRFEPSDSSYDPLEREITIEEGEKTLIKTGLQGFGTLDLSMDWGYEGDFILSSKEHGSYTAGEGEHRLPEGKWTVKGRSNQGSGRKTVDIDTGGTASIKMTPSGRSNLLLMADMRSLNEIEETGIFPSMFSFGLRYELVLNQGVGFFVKAMTGYTGFEERSNYLAEEGFLLEERLSLGYHAEFGITEVGFCFGGGPVLDYLYCNAQSPFMSSASEAGQMVGGFEAYVGAWLGGLYIDFGYAFFPEQLSYPALEAGESLYTPSAVSLSMGYRFSFIGGNETEELPSIGTFKSGGAR